MVASTSAPTKAAAAKPTGAMVASTSVEASSSTSVEAAAAKAPGISLAEEEREPHQSCGQNGRHKELGTRLFHACLFSFFTLYRWLLRRNVLIFWTPVVE